MRKHLLVLACGMIGISGWGIGYVRELEALGERWAWHSIAIEEKGSADDLQRAENHWRAFSIVINIRFAF